MVARGVSGALIRSGPLLIENSRLIQAQAALAYSPGLEFF